MRQIRFFISILVLFGCSSNLFGAAAESFQLFQDGNQLYRDGKYEKAIETYETLAKREAKAEVYYNLGNAYFKNKQLGMAILNYERARRSKPRDYDVRANLLYANQLIEYKVEDKRNWYLRMKSQILSRFTFKECSMLALSAYFLFILGLFLSLLFNKKPLFGRSGAIALSFVIISSFPLLLKYAETGMNPEAIVIANQSEVRYGPASSDRIAFRLVEGLKVSVADKKEDWYRIQLRDGGTGWVSQSEVTII